MFFFCTTQTVNAELNFSLWSGKKEKYENLFLITWQSYLQIFFLDICYPKHSVACTIWYLGYLFVVRLTLFACWRVPFFVRVPRCQYVEAPERVTNKTQTRILDNRLYYTRKIELHRKGKKSRTVHITPIVICPSGSEISVLITARKVHYSKMGKVPTTVLWHINHCRLFNAKSSLYIYIK